MRKLALILLAVVAAAILLAVVHGGGSALTRMGVCALGKYENSGHAPTVQAAAVQCQPVVRAVSPFGRAVRHMDIP